MKEILRLTKLFINTNLGLSMIQYNRKHNKKEFFKEIGIPIVIVFACIPAYGMYIAYMYFMYGGMASIGQESVLLPLAFTIISFIIVFLGLAYVMSEFYFSSGIEMLLPLPIKPRSIIIGKFINICLMESLLVLLSMLPPVIMYGIGQGMGFLYYLLALLVMLLLPIIPVGLMTMVIMLIMRSNRFKGKKDIFQVVMLSLILVVAIGGSLYISTTASSLSDGSDQMINIQALSTMLADNQFLLNNVIRMYPLSHLIAGALNVISLTSFLNFLGFMAVSAVVFCLMVMVGEKVYYKGLIAGSENGKRKKVLTTSALQKSLSKKRSPALGVFKMDLYLLIRIPVCFFNNILGVVIMPVCIGISLFFVGKKDMDLAAGATSFYAQYPEVVTMILIGLFMFLGIAGTTTATSFSREGKNIWLSRIVPIKAVDQIIGRSLSGASIQLLGILCTLIMILFIMPVTLGTVVISIVLGLLGNVPLLFLGLLVDMYRPLLNWDNPQKAVKNNMNVVITLLVGILYFVVVMAISFITSIFLAPAFGYGVFIGISLVTSVLLFLVIKKNMEARMRVMQVD